MTPRNAKKLLPLLAGCALLLPLLTGCSGKAAELSKQEQSQFKGGPMPESARKIMQEKMEAANKNAPKTAPNAGTQ